MLLPPDQTQRETALDPTRSFIVQAPAGSGKTELLTQRYLTLLAHVHNDPEEIIAITFTRKAAAEMRARILSALAKGETPAAYAARQRDQQSGWQLLDNPNRLRIMTIDSLCMNLTRQMPVLTKYGPNLTISDDPSILYRQATQQLLMGLADEETWSQALEDLLLHLDNDIYRVMQLLMDMLANRDQWLPYILTIDAFSVLEKALETIVIEVLCKCYESIPKILIDEFIALINFAADHIENNASLTYCRNLKNLPIPSLDNYHPWLAIAKLCLNKSCEWRKKFTLNEGFPSESKDKKEKLLFSEYKKRMQKLITDLAEQTNLQVYFADLISAPPTKYTSEQACFIQALITLLPILVAQLHVVFAQHGKVDYIEVALRALQALGEPEKPTNLALALDYQIQHLLIDEFQDTSVTQLRLIERLISGWQANEGRTLFLVGDPMQSIYRFRKAEVGLFLQVQKYGIGEIQLKKLTLSANFRATSPLVEWHNHVFAQLFPKQADPSVGAIPYSPSQAAIQNEQAQQAVFYHVVANEENAEAQTIVTILQRVWQENSHAKVAILVRARQHLRNILPSLRNANIPYRAIEIATLQDEALIQDLLALTRALLHPADRIAWIAILRAPWCGLSLCDLHHLLADDHQQTVWNLLQQAQSEKLTEDGKVRLNVIKTIFAQQLAKRGRCALREWIKETWLLLQGPACSLSNSDLANANCYFGLLDKVDDGGDISDFTVLENRLRQLSATPNNDKHIKLEIMTVHKAKGLEFDVVILPGLEKSTRPNATQLMLWAERPSVEGSTDLVIGSIKAAAQTNDPIYDYLKREENKKSLYETQRLLYVATTRAKKQLHLLVNLAQEQPSSQSLLTHLLPFIKEDITLLHHAVTTKDGPKQQDLVIEKKACLKRIKVNYLYCGNINK